MRTFLFIAAAFDISHKRSTQPQAKQRLQWRYGYARQDVEDTDWFASGSGPPVESSTFSPLSRRPTTPHPLKETLGRICLLFHRTSCRFTKYHTANKCTNCMSFMLNHFFPIASLHETQRTQIQYMLPQQYYNEKVHIFNT